MSEIKLFRLDDGKATDLPGEGGGLEKSLQTLMEQNLETLLAVRFVASEHSTGKLHGGRIDSLGLDENHCPVILEYKRAISENVMSQGLYYLDWLMDHKADFKLMVMERFGKETADAIDWSSPRLICVAADFTKHDEHAVRQINRNIDLIRYRRFGKELLALELLTSTTADALLIEDEPGKPKPAKAVPDKPIAQMIAELDRPLHDLWEELRAYILALGSDVVEKHLKLYVAFRRIRNFASVVFGKKGLTLYLNLDPAKYPNIDGFRRDVSKIGHWATGDIELWVTDKEGLLKALPFVKEAFEGK